MSRPEGLSNVTITFLLSLFKRNSPRLDGMQWCNYRNLEGRRQMLLCSQAAIERGGSGARDMVGEAVFTKVRLPHQLDLLFLII